MSEYKLEITVCEGWVGEHHFRQQGMSPPTILRIRETDRSLIRYKNVGRRLFRFAGMHAFDGQTDVQTDVQTDFGSNTI